MEKQTLAPRDAITHAAALHGAGNHAGAEKLCKDILAVNDEYPPAWHLLGLMAFHARKAEAAAQMLHKAVLLDSSIAIYHRDLAQVVCNGGKPGDALVIIERALRIEPNDPNSHYIAGIALGALGAHQKAVEAYSKVVELNPGHGLAFNNLGAALEATGDKIRAKKAYTDAVNLNANHAEAQNNLAAILIAEGDVDGATKHFEAAISARPNFVDPHYNLSTIKTYTEDDAHITQMEAIARNTAQLPSQSRIRLCFALGKAWEDIGKYAKAFDLYQTGNKAKRETFNYNEDGAINVIDRIKSHFGSSYFIPAAPQQKNDETPIFIVGMPRSGSTLVEQILCSHADIHGGGELSTMAKVVSTRVKNFPQGLADLSDADFKAMGDEYLSAVKSLAPQAKRIVDKMPANFHYAGLIAKILPGAHIINTQRNPMDTCLSNYARLFNSPVDFAYDLEELGRYYNRYNDLMAHWQKVLPKTMGMDIVYEDVVADLETQARGLIDFVGLPWDENCLQFYNNKRSVHTASVAQVRKPIYKSSVKRWARFGEALTPLEALVTTNT